MDAKACLGVEIHYEIRFGTAACQPNPASIARFSSLGVPIDTAVGTTPRRPGSAAQAPATTAVPLVETINMVPVPVLMVS